MLPKEIKSTDTLISVDNEKYRIMWKTFSLQEKGCYTIINVWQMGKITFIDTINKQIFKKFVETEFYSYADIRHPSLLKIDKVTNRVLFDFNVGKPNTDSYVDLLYILNLKNKKVQVTDGLD